MDGVKQMYKPEAEKRVRIELVIEAIRNAEKIEPTEADIEKAIAEQAEQMGQEVETFKKNLTEEQKGYLKDNAAIRLVLDLLKKDAKITEKKAEEPEEKKPVKKPAAKKSAKKADDEEAPAEEKPAKKPAAKKATKKSDADETSAEEKTAKKPAAKKTAKKTDAE